MPPLSSARSLQKLGVALSLFLLFASWAHAATFEGKKTRQKAIETSFEWRVSRFDVTPFFRPQPRPGEEKKHIIIRSRTATPQPQAPHLGRWQLRLGPRPRRRGRRAVVWPDDAVDQPRLRPRRRPRAARRRRWVLSWREQRQQRRERHGLLYLDGTGRQWRHKHEHKLRRTGLGDELERREEREEVMREKRREEREERREEREEEGCRRRLSSTSNKQKPYKQSALSAPCHSTNSAFRISEGGERERASQRAGGPCFTKTKGPMSAVSHERQAPGTDFFCFYALLLLLTPSLLHFSLLLPNLHRRLPPPPLSSAAFRRLHLSLRFCIRRKVSFCDSFRTRSSFCLFLSRKRNSHTKQKMSRQLTSLSFPPLTTSCSRPSRCSSRCSSRCYSRLPTRASCGWLSGFFRRRRRRRRRRRGRERGKKEKSRD